MSGESEADVRNEGSDFGQEGELSGGSFVSDDTFFFYSLDEGGIGEMTTWFGIRSVTFEYVGSRRGLPDRLKVSKLTRAHTVERSDIVILLMQNDDLT